MSLRWGICGAGKISSDFVVGIKTRPSSEHTVVAVAARSVESSAKFAAVHRIAKQYGSYEDLARDAEVDVVYVGTIHPTHHQCVKLMLESGKSVLCEKPLTMTQLDTTALIQTAKDCGKFLMEGMWTRFFPAVAEVRRRLSNESIGEVKVVQANFGFKRSDNSGTSRLDDPNLGGGAVLDVGVYPISLATMVFKERPSSIHATGWLTSTGVDEFAAITLYYKGGRVAQLSCSIGVDLLNEAAVFGTKGKMKLLKPFWCPTKLETPDVRLTKVTYLHHNAGCFQAYVYINH
jgi:dihydrodiol dehydrogenase / D-xylose 1-dehydrogenase (NADP)